MSEQAYISNGLGDYDVYTEPHFRLVGHCLRLGGEQLVSNRARVAASDARPASTVLSAGGIIIMVVVGKRFHMRSEYVVRLNVAQRR